MKKTYNIIAILILTFALNSCYAQKKETSLDVAMQNHIKEFKEGLKEKDADVYVILRYDFTDYEINGVKFVEPTLDAQYIKEGTCYLVQFTLKNDKLSAVNFKVINKGKKELELINMMNGKDYDF